MARKLIVEIIGDASSLEREFKRSARGAKQFERGMSQVGRGAAAASLSFHGLGRAAAFTSAQFLGGAGVVYGIKSTISAAMESQRVLGQTRNAVLRSGLSWKDHAKQIDATLASQSNLSAFDDEQLSATFANLVRRTGDVNQALRLNALAADVARGRNIGLEQSQGLVLKASIGNIGALRRLGINIGKNATATQALDMLQRKYAGSAAAYGRTAAGSMDRFRVAIENAQEKIGNALLPTIADLSTKSADWLNKPENMQKIADSAEQTAAAFERIAAAAAAVGGPLGKLQQGLDPAGWLGAFGTKGDSRSTGDKITKFLFGTDDPVGDFERHWRKMLAHNPTAKMIFEQFGIGTGPAPELISEHGRGGGYTPAAPPATTGGGRGGGRGGGGGPARIPGTLTPFLAYRLALAEATKARGDDERVLAQIVAVLRARFGTTKNLKARTAIQEALNQYQSQLSGLLDEDAQVVKDAADKTKAARQARRERARAAAQAARELRMVYETPLGLQLAEARAGATGHGMRAALVAMRAAARKALRTGNLLVQGQIDAWNTITSANQRLADMNKSRTSRMITAYHATSAAMTHGGQQLNAGAAGVLGQPIILQLDGRTIATAVVPHIQRSARRQTATTTGRSSGTVHGI